MAARLLYTAKDAVEETADIDCRGNSIGSRNSKGVSMRIGFGFLIIIAGTAGAFGQSEITLGAKTKPVYGPITPEGRARWFVSSTIGPSSLIAGVFTAGKQTLTNSPEEYGTHWDGFGKRYGLRLTGRATSNLMEAGIGSLWGEDPRYFREPGQSIKRRLGNIVRGVVLAHDREGREMPAYARYIAIPGSAYVSNAWRPDSRLTSQPIR